MVTVIGVGGTVLAAAIGVAGTVMSTWFSNKENRRLEEGRRQHERLIERERWEHRERARLQEERLRAYQNFSKVVTLVAAQYPLLGPTDDQIAEAYTAIEILASEPIREVAHYLFHLAGDIREAKGKEQEELLSRFRKERIKFREAVLEETGAIHQSEIQNQPGNSPPETNT